MNIVVNPMPVAESKPGPAGYIKFEDGGVYQWAPMTATKEGTLVEFAVPYEKELCVVVAGGGSSFGRRRWWFRSASRPVAVYTANGTPKGFTAYATESAHASYTAFGR